jgi:hypothetical protein
MTSSKCALAIEITPLFHGTEPYMTSFGSVGKRENAAEYRANLRFVSRRNNLVRMGLSRKCLIGADF